MLECVAVWHQQSELAKKDGASIPFFVNRKMDVVDSAMDRESIDQVQRHTAHLVCAVINSVTQMGWQFPGSAGPGKSIYKLTAQPFASTDSVKSAPPLGSNASLGQE